MPRNPMIRGAGSPAKGIAARPRDTNRKEDPQAAAHRPGPGPAAVRALIGNGNLGGVDQRDDAEIQALRDTGVAETRALPEGDRA